MVPSADDIAVTMSSRELPLTKQYSIAYNTIDNFTRYMNSIEDPDVRTRFEAEFGPIREFQGPPLASFQEIYKTFLPSGVEWEALSEPRKQQPRRRSTASFETPAAFLRPLQEWAARTGVTDLTTDFKSITDRGQVIWQESWLAAQATVDRIIGQHTFKGGPTGTAAVSVSVRRVCDHPRRGRRPLPTRTSTSTLMWWTGSCIKELWKTIPAGTSPVRSFPKLTTNVEIRRLVTTGPILSRDLVAAFPGVARLTNVEVAIWGEEPNSGQ